MGARGKPMKWTPAEDLRLAENWAGHDPDVIEHLFPGRGYGALAARACTLSLMKSAPPSEVEMEVFRRKSLVKPRNCISCGQKFQSEGAHNRMCDGCRGEAGASIRERGRVVGGVRV